MADDILAKEGAATPRLDTLSYFNKSEADADDWFYLRMVEQYRGGVGSHIDASKAKGSMVSIKYPGFAPLPGFTGINHPIEAERARIIERDGYRAVLSGIGGDEFLGGNPDPRMSLGDLIVQVRLGSLCRQLVAWSLAKRTPWI